MMCMLSEQATQAVVHTVALTTEERKVPGIWIDLQEMWEKKSLESRMQEHRQ